MLRSSILGKEFVNYRKTRDVYTRSKFSNSVRSKGMGYIPIVVDSVDSELSEVLSRKDMNIPRFCKYGLEIPIHMDLTIADLLKEVKIELIKRDYNSDLHALSLGLEDGTIPNLQSDLGSLYKTYRNQDDKILYVLLTKETSMYGYITSILQYLFNNMKSFFSRN